MVLERKRNADTPRCTGRLKGHGRDARFIEGMSAFGKAMADEEDLENTRFCETKPFVMCANAVGRVCI